MVPLRSMVKPDARSPYQRYGKHPYKYSELYMRWRRLMVEGKEQEANQIGFQHSAKWLGAEAPVEEEDVA